MTRDNDYVLSLICLDWITSVPIFFLHHLLLLVLVFFLSCADALVVKNTNTLLTCGDDGRHITSFGVGHSFTRQREEREVMNKQREVAGWTLTTQKLKIYQHTYTHIFTYTPTHPPTPKHIYIYIIYIYITNKHKEHNVLPAGYFEVKRSSNERKESTHNQSYLLGAWTHWTSKRGTWGARSPVGWEA